MKNKNLSPDVWLQDPEEHDSMPQKTRELLYMRYFFIFHSPKDDEIKKQMERDIKLKKLLK
jgi:hypothetical protein